MKRDALITIIALVALIMCAPVAFAQKKNKEKIKEKEFEPGERMERTLTTSPNVVVSLCLASGDVTVKGWDRSEVKVVAESVNQLELQGGGKPTQRVQVVMSNAPKPPGDMVLPPDCHAASDLQINVPRGAILDIVNRNGSVDISDVAEARIINTSGDITLNKVARGVRAQTLNGDVTVADSGGRIVLMSVSGDIEATNIRSTEASDDFSAHSTSGDIDLDGVEQARLSVNTTSGKITMSGALAERGQYELKTFSGDVELNIPSDSSFRLNARTPQGEITTDFAIKSASTTPSQEFPGGESLTGTVGTGDASLTIQTFSGSVRLQKRK